MGHDGGLRIRDLFQFLPRRPHAAHPSLVVMDYILAHPALDDREESVRIAVRALGDMRNSVHASPSACAYHPTNIQSPLSIRGP